MRIAKDRKTGRSRGFAIVEFTQPGAVEKAVKRSGRMIRGREVTVKPFKNETDAKEADSDQSFSFTQGDRGQVGNPNFSSLFQTPTPNCAIAAIFFSGAGG